jgi:hypothetical protein
MTMRFLVPLAAAAILTASAALAQTAAPSEPAPAPAREVAADAELAAMSGGTNTTTNAAIALTEQDLTAVNTGNHITADTVTTGAITLGGAAFSDFNGVGNVIMNTGNNNNIQTSMSVTIVITP